MLGSWFLLVHTCLTYDAMNERIPPVIVLGLYQTLHEMYGSIKTN